MPWTGSKKKGYTKKGKGNGGHVKRPKMYEALRDRDMPKAKAAKIANSKKKGGSKKGGKKSGGKKK